MLKKL
jgi:hypothetical protein